MLRTLVEHHPVSEGEDGYSLELFNAVGDTIAVITVPESSIEPLLTEDEIFSVRSLEEHIRAIVGVHIYLTPKMIICWN